MKINDVLSAGLSLIRLLSSLFVLWLTLGWKVRKTRKAFENQLVNEGMARKDAKRLSAQFSVMQNDIMGVFKRSFVRNM